MKLREVLLNYEGEISRLKSWLCDTCMDESEKKCNECEAVVKGSFMDVEKTIKIVRGIITR